MKKIFKKNQIIITALAVMIAAAGYISYSDSKLKTTDTSSKTGSEKTQETDSTVDMDSVLQDIESLDMDITDETVASSEDNDSTETTDTSLDTPGEAVLTGASTYMAQAKINREQIRSQNKETLLEIINNSQLSEEERQSAIASMVSMTEMVEKEAAAELLLEAKGFPDVVVNLTGETADVVVPSTSVDDASRAQIEDIVKRKTGIAAENIVISPMSGEDIQEDAEK
ncbi:MAG: SpoIIIAH-like family protein [Oliverpabstia sp.]|nr:SpoIIIAH-like family protein [Lachnospiraceae bacterium]MDY5026689.1 SpoIIIAH-like family protein [Oliverpabstia sp.]